MHQQNLNLLLDVGFNREVGEDGAIYWKKDDGDLSRLIDTVDGMEEAFGEKFGLMSKDRIRTAYSWEFIGKEYEVIWDAEVI